MGRAATPGAKRGRRRWCRRWRPSGVCRCLRINQTRRAQRVVLFTGCAFKRRLVGQLRSLNACPPLVISKTPRQATRLLAGCLRRVLLVLLGSSACTARREDEEERCDLAACACDDECDHAHCLLVCCSTRSPLLLVCFEFWSMARAGCPRPHYTHGSAERLSARTESSRTPLHRSITPRWRALSDCEEQGKLDRSPRPERPAALFRRVRAHNARLSSSKLQTRSRRSHRSLRFFPPTPPPPLPRPPPPDADPCPAAAPPPPPPPPHPSPLRGCAHL